MFEVDTFPLSSYDASCVILYYHLDYYFVSLGSTIRTSPRSCKFEELQSVDDLAFCQKLPNALSGLIR